MGTAVAWLPPQTSQMWQAFNVPFDPEALESSFRCSRWCLSSSMRFQKYYLSRRFRFPLQCAVVGRWDSRYDTIRKCQRALENWSHRHCVLSKRREILFVLVTTRKLYEFSVATMSMTLNDFESTQHFQIYSVSYHWTRGFSAPLAELFCNLFRISEYLSQYCLNLALHKLLTYRVLTYLLTYLLI